MSSALLVAGALGDEVGRRRVFVAGLGLIAEAFPDPAPRKRATEIGGARLNAGIAIGPLLAADRRLTTWRSVYAVEAVLPVGLIVAATRLPLLAPARMRRVDFAGAVTLVAAITLLVPGLVEGRLGWEHPATTLPRGVAVLVLVLFVLVERA